MTSHHAIDPGHTHLHRPQTALLKRGGKSFRGFTLIELLVVISIIALLMGVLLPALAKARGAARNADSIVRLRQIGIGLHMYADQHKGFFPDVTEADSFDETWMHRIRFYINSSEQDAQKIYRSPHDANQAAWAPGSAEPKFTSYGLNAYVTRNHPPYWGLKLHAVLRPSKFIPLAEMRDAFREDHFTPMFWHDNAGSVSKPFADPATPRPEDPGETFEEDHEGNWADVDPDQRPGGIAHQRHGGAGNYAFADGHAAAVKLEQCWQPAATNDGSNPPLVNWFDPFARE